MKCKICGYTIKEEDYGGGKTWDGGHNPDPWPCKPGDKCCIDCNENIIEPAQIYLRYRIKNENWKKELAEDKHPIFIDDATVPKINNLTGDNKDATN